MAILNVKLESMGQSGVCPRIVYINTNDSLGKVTTPGYLNKLPSQGYLISNKDIALVVVQDFPGAPAEVVFLDIKFSNGQWSLVTNSPDSPGAAGTVLRSDGIRWLASTATFSDTYPDKGLLVANGANTVEGINMVPDSALVTDASGAVGFAAGAAGDVLTSNGVGASPSMLPISRGLQSIQVFETSGTWTKPAGITNVIVWIIGGGGGGGGADGVGAGNESDAGGGGAGGVSMTFVDVTLTASESVTIGAGGLGGTVGISDGSPGGTSSFGSIISATGGGGGINGISTTAESIAAGGSGGSGASGIINLNGGNGGTGRVVKGELTFNGSGGNNIFSSTSYGSGKIGEKFGGGGSGAVSSSVNAVGGTGASGACIVYEYIL